MQQNQSAFQRLCSVLFPSNIISLFTHKHTHTHIYKHKHTHTNNTHTHTHTHTHTQTHTHKHTHIHTHTHLEKALQEAALPVGHPVGPLGVVGLLHVEPLHLEGDVQVGGGVRVGLCGRAELDVAWHAAADLAGGCGSLKCKVGEKKELLLPRQKALFALKS